MELMQLRLYVCLSCYRHHESSLRAMLCAHPNGKGGTNNPSRGKIVTVYNRIDPIGCACTDCLTGYSVPLDACPLETFDAYLDGWVMDASSSEESTFDYYLELREG